MAAWLGSRVGTAVNVLRETEDTGRCEHYANVRMASKGLAGEIVAARVISAGPDTLTAEALQ